MVDCLAIRNGRRDCARRSWEEVSCKSLVLAVNIPASGLQGGEGEGGGGRRVDSDLSNRTERLRAERLLVGSNGDGPAGGMVEAPVPGERVEMQIAWSRGPLESLPIQ